MSEQLSRRAMIEQLRELGTPKTIIRMLRDFNTTPDEWCRYAKAYAGLNVKDRSAHYEVAKLAKTSSDTINDAVIRYNLRRNRAQAAIERDEKQIEAVEDAIDDEEGDQVLAILQHRYGMDTKGADYFGKPEREIGCPECHMETVIILAQPNGTGNAWCKENLGGCEWHLTKDDHIKGLPKVDLKPYLGEPKWLKRLMGASGKAVVTKQIIHALEHQKEPWKAREISDKWLMEKTGKGAWAIRFAKKCLRAEHNSWIAVWRSTGGKTWYGARPDRLLQALLDMREAQKVPTAKMGTRQRLKKGGT